MSENKSEREWYQILHLLSARSTQCAISVLKALLRESERERETLTFNVCMANLATIYTLTVCCVHTIAHARTVYAVRDAAFLELCCGFKFSAVARAQRVCASAASLR